MSSASPLVRQEHIRSLGALAGILAHAEPPAPVGPGPAASTPLSVTLRDAVHAECIQCGIHLGGDELLALAPGAASGAEAAPANPRLARLRLGYCARAGCDSCYYRVTFEPRPGLDWGRILPPTELGTVEIAPAEDPGLAERRAAHGASVRRGLRRAGLAFAAFALLLLARHWYQGGTIPLLREPEQFEVEVPAPPPFPGQRP